MKNKQNRIHQYRFLLNLVALLILLFITNSAIAQAATIRMSNTSITLDTGKTKVLSITGTKSKVSWSSSKSSVASVSSSGKVTAKAAGTATITASVAGKKLTSKVTVFCKSIILYFICRNCSYTIGI